MRPRHSIILNAQANSLVRCGSNHCRSPPQHKHPKADQMICTHSRAAQPLTIWRSALLRVSTFLSFLDAHEGTTITFCANGSPRINAHPSVVGCRKGDCILLGKLTRYAMPFVANIAAHIYSRASQSTWPDPRDSTFGPGGSHTIDIGGPPDCCSRYCQTRKSQLITLRAKATEGRTSLDAITSAE